MIFTFVVYKAWEVAPNEKTNLTEVNINAPTLKDALRQFPNYYKFIEEAK